MSPEYAQELARQVDELENENAEQRAKIAQLSAALDRGRVEIQGLIDETISERDARIAELKEWQRSMLKQLEQLTAINVGLLALSADLKMALKPFAAKTDAVSLMEALGHITREDLDRARIAYNKADGFGK
jgi:predicted RNase H-like nuclease (RuvC/YqgF family)